MEPNWRPLNWRPLNWRPLTLADAGAIARLYALAESLEPINEHPSEQDTADELASPAVSLPEGSVSAWDGDRLVAFAYLIARAAADPVHPMQFDAMVHPEYRDDALAGRLLAWITSAAPELHRRRHPGAPLELHGSAHENQRWYAGVLAAHGFRHVRSFVDMRVSLARPLPAPAALPRDLLLTGYQEKYEELTRQARNDTFAAHWGSTVQPAELWRRLVVGSRQFRPELSFLLLRPGADEVAAFVLGACYESHTEATGQRELYVSHVGTRADLRGRGVATALLGHTLARARELGYHSASLAVDTGNATGALGAYRRCGFQVAERWFGYVREGG